MFYNTNLRGSSADLQTFSKLNVSFSSQGPYANHTPVIYFPWFGILEFIGYLGWIKVAETLLNPWGDDDEDFQINYLIDRNLQVDFNFIYLFGCVTKNETDTK